mgnify:CR=1 FL=1
MRNKSLVSRLALIAKVFIGVLIAIPLFAILMSGMLSSCALKYTDVSGEPEYASLLNGRYSLLTEMTIFGVNLPPGYGKDINVYDIYPTRLSGPEIRSEEVLKPGTILEIQGIRKSINHFPGDPSVEALVKIAAFEPATNVPITISLEDLLSSNLAKRIDAMPSGREHEESP